MLTFKLGNKEEITLEVSDVDNTVMLGIKNINESTIYTELTSEEVLTLRQLLDITVNSSKKEE